MPIEGRYQVQLLNHCWTLYTLLTDAFSLPERFHVEFPTSVEDALISGALHIRVPVAETRTLSLREEYAFGQQGLIVSRYSYNIIDNNGKNIFRADNLPYHQRDYRNQLLSYPPHHIHDEQERIRSFSGHLENFITETVRLFSAQSS